MSQGLGAGAALGPVPAGDRLDVEPVAAQRLQRRVLGLRVGVEMVDRHHDRGAEAAHVLDVAGEVGKAPLLFS